MKKLLFIALCLSIPLVHAEVASTPAVVSSYKGPDPFSIESLLQLFLGLGLVLGTIFLMAWLLRKVSVLPGQHKKLKVVAALSLGQKERAVLIQVGEEQMLLGVSQNQVTLLKSFEAPVISTDDLVVESAFAKKLNQYLSKRSQ